MASQQHLPTMENLPEDMLRKIFFPLQAKQLAQMRSVSKLWNALLSQSSFVKSHLVHSIHNKEEILLVFRDREGLPKPFTEQTVRSPQFALTNFVNFPVIRPSETVRGSTHVIGSVNGLVCFSYESSHELFLHIWNPSISAVLNLPPIPFTPSPVYCPSEIQFRFGFDPKTDDYKIVKLRRTRPPSTPQCDNLSDYCFYIDEGILEVEVYSMRKGYWKSINHHGFPSHIKNIRNNDFLCVDGHDGHLHWLGYSNDMAGNLQTIVAFDLGDETFREIPLPDSILEYNLYTMYVVLGVLNQKLCVMAVKEGECEVWIMEEYGVASSWVKNYVYTPFSHTSKLLLPYGFTLHNKFTFLHDEHDAVESNIGLVLYNPSLAKAKNFSGTCWPFDRIVSYVESLVWPVVPVNCEPS